MKVAVVGLGYVGLPLAIRLAQVGFTVSGIDINRDKIASLQKGRLSFAQDEPMLQRNFLNEFKKTKLLFYDKFEPIKNCQVIFINVETPVTGKSPNYSSLILALKSIAPNLKKGATVVIESTVSPNTTKKLIIPTLEKQSKLMINKDFYVATVPERIRPNHIFEQLTKLSRVVGISDPKIKNLLNSLYKKITSGEIDFTDLTTAETVKTVENSFRDVNIAFANEVAIACEELGVNVWDVVKLVNKSPFHNMHKPGGGVGGHCIPKDPWLLSSSVKKKKMKLIADSRYINDNMPRHVFEITKNALKSQGLSIKNSKVVILGFSYVEDTDDTRNSPTIALGNIFKKESVNFVVHDPVVKEFSGKPIKDTLKKADCMILMVAHSYYKKLNLEKLGLIMSKKIIVDGRNFFNRQEVEKKGFKYFGLGNT